LGDPDTSNSTVAWPVKNLAGLIVGISQTDIADPNQEPWSCFYFFGGPYANSGKACRGFAWEKGRMRALLPLAGGTHSFAAGANNLGEITGWAENGVVDGACVAPQKLQFKPVIWGPGLGSARELPLVGSDTSGAATAINDRGQAVGISGICDIAVGRYTAAHAVLWDNGQAIELKGFDAPYWNTPNAINQHGDVVGFMGTPGDIDGNLFRAFIWISGSEKIQQIEPLAGDAYANAQGINESRQVVGTSCKEGAVDCRAFLWENGVTHDISRQPGYTGVLTSAQDINNFGVITGRAVDAAGIRKAFIAVPVH
jgi:probable HAF family extracellular repeat protein